MRHVATLDQRLSLDLSYHSPSSLSVMCQRQQQCRESAVVNKMIDGLLFCKRSSEWHAAQQVASSGQWKSATLRLNGATVAPGQPDSPLLEFVVTDGGQWDKPIDGGRCASNQNARAEDTKHRHERAACRGTEMFVFAMGLPIWNERNFTHTANCIAGGNYVISERGRFTLRDGAIAAVEGEPMLVVSDLDDTMIGDDEATAVFKRFWDTMVTGQRLRG